MTMVVVVVAFVVGVGAVLALSSFAAKVPGLLLQRKLESRLKEMTSPEGEDEGNHDAIVKAGAGGMMPALDRAISRTNRGNALSAWIDQSGSKATLSSVLGVATVLGLMMALVAAMFTHAGWSMPVGFGIGFALPFLVLKMKRTRRMRAFEEQFPEALDLIARALKAGHAFATGLKMVADEMEEPVGPEFRKTFDEQNFGLPLKDSLENLTVRIPVLDVRFFATAVLIQRETGGNLSEILENLAHVVRERFKILRQVRVYTAHGRMTGYVLLALPAFLSVALMFINPDHMNLLFRERMGQQMLMAAIVMQTAGFLWIKKIVKIEV